MSEALSFSDDRCVMVVLGIGTIQGFRIKIHARQICAGVAPLTRANSARSFTICQLAQRPEPRAGIGVAAIIRTRCLC